MKKPTLAEVVQAILLAALVGGAILFGLEQQREADACRASGGAPVAGLLGTVQCAELKR